MSCATLLNWCLVVLIKVDAIFIADLPDPYSVRLQAPLPGVDVHEHCSTYDGHGMKWPVLYDNHRLKGQALYKIMFQHVKTVPVWIITHKYIVNASELLSEIIVGRWTSRSFMICLDNNLLVKCIGWRETSKKSLYTDTIVPEEAVQKWLFLQAQIQVLV